MNELDFIQALKSQSISGVCSTVLGDDCVEIAPLRLATTDMLMDRVHFDTNTTSMELIARKAVCVNLSDLAASGAVPESLLVSLALPNSWSTETALLFHKYIAATASHYECPIIGGDTNVWKGPLVINIVATGRMHWRGQIGRHGAKAGDQIFVTGRLGGSLLSGRHLTFTPRVAESQWLLDHVPISAMMDLSDGMATDARRMADASQVDFILSRATLPIHPDCGETEEPAWEQALCDGEDFELLFCVQPQDAVFLKYNWSWPIPLTHIGEVVSGDGKVWLKDASGKTLLTKQGFVHR